MKKRYLAKFNPKLNKGVYGISLVESPAMEGTFIALSKEEELQFKTVDEEQRIVAGLVLEPNKDIYRNQGGEEFYISFESDTIKELCYAFTKNQNNSNSTIEHSKNNIAGVTFVENWIVRDEKLDTSVALGFSAKEGSWVSVAKIDDDVIWNDYIKTGKVLGFSIDALVSLEEVNLNKHNMSKEQEQSIWDMLKDLPNQIKLALTPEKKIELGSIKTADGTITLEFEGDTMQSGGSVWIMAEDGTKVPAPVGEHPLEDGTVLVVMQEGIIGEIKQMADPNAPADMAEGDGGKVSNDAKIASEIESAIKSILIKYGEQKQEVDTLKQTIVEMKEQLIELGLKPASEGIKQPEKNVVVDLKAMTPKERIAHKINEQKN